MTLKKIVQDPDGLKSMKFVDGGKRQSASYTWYRGANCHFGPTSDHLGYWRGYADYFGKGLMPTAPLIDHTTRITAFGSCFAANISSWLARRKYKVLNKDVHSKAYIVRAGEGFVNTYSILQQFKWAFEAEQPTVELWHGYDASAYGYDEEARLGTLEIFQNTDLFVLTFGLSEVWYDKVSDEVFWRAVPRDKYDERRHGFRTVSPDENYRNIKTTVDLIKKYRPNASVIATLSPIPLVATFRPLPCPVANSYSKASLRCAIDRIFAEGVGEKGIYYWPSYEIVLDGFRNTWEDDLRHVRKPILTFVMKLFERHWCVGSVPDKEISLALYNAKVSDGSISRALKRQIRDSSASTLGEVLSQLRARGKISGDLVRTIEEAHAS